jgi:Tol biopolymer transport system component
MTINWLQDWNERPEVQADIFLTDPKYDVFIKDTLAKCQRKIWDDKNFLITLEDKIADTILDTKERIISSYGDENSTAISYYEGKIDALKELQELLDNYIQ